MISQRDSSDRSVASWLIQVGVIFMAFGIGSFLGYLAGSRQTPPPQPQSVPGVLTRAEAHANNAEYAARHLTIGISKLERACSPHCR